MQISTDTAENHTKFLKFARNTSVMWSCNPLYNGNLKDTAKWYLPSHIHCRTSYKSKDKESTCLFTVIYTEWDITHTSKKQSPVICNIMNKTRVHFVRLNKYCMTLIPPSRRIMRLMSLEESMKGCMSHIKETWNILVVVISNI